MKQRPSHHRLPGYRLLTALAGVALCTAVTLTAPPDTKPADKDVDPDHAAKMVKGLEIFTKQVRPILAQKCLKCHGGKTTENEFNISDRPTLLKGGTSGPAVVPGKPRESLLYQLITHAKKPFMPHEASKLPDQAIAQIAAWIENGAPFDQPLAGNATTKPSWTDKHVPDDAKQFWSCQPLRRLPPPAVKNEAWVKTPIDRFILARLDAGGLTPNPAADKRQLMRRAYFDLIGLPPTPQEADAFLNDQSPEAYQHLIDKLLLSPRYGERWARYWLDLARFAESHGFEHDYDRPTAYHYRDFVIKALNDDLPYDTFIKWQLAGDEYEPENPLALMATGFLAAGVHSTQITKNEVERHRYDEMDDMLATTGTAMLGLTVGCARCHDHKFDPIPQRDYYRLLSTFTTTVRSELEINLDKKGYEIAKAAFEKEHAPYVAALESYEREQLPGRLAVWEKSEAAKLDRYPWIILDLNDLESAGGATFAKQPDGSVLAGGKNPDFDTYNFTATTDVKNIAAIRLEALADPSMVKGGPGRASNGNFALSDFRVAVAPKASDPKPTPIKLKNPRATFEQNGLSIAAAIDSDEKSAWAVDPQFGKNHAAAFETETPLGDSGGVTLTFTLTFKNNNGHNIGRPRLSVSTLTNAELSAPGVPQPILTALQTPDEKRTATQKTALLQWYRTRDAEWQKLHQQMEDHVKKAPKPNTVKALIASEGLPAVRLHTQGDDFFKQCFYLRRGDPEQKEAVAPQGFLQILMPAPDDEKRWQAPPPTGWRTSYRRRALAEWLTDVDSGAGRLLARVIVNRMWQYHLGRGIVTTPSDFGHRGEPPTHPELLDWLATELINNGWKLKHIHKLIMISSVYQVSSHVDEMKTKVDRDNRLLWRKPLRRLEGEAIRDSLLSVSGMLDEKMYGPGTLDPTSKRRSIYFTVKRSKLMPMMVVFDAPEALVSIGDRPTTTIALQALMLMNNPQIRDHARQLALRVAGDPAAPLEQTIQTAYRIAVARLPSGEELAESTAFVRQQAESYAAAGKTNARELALTDFCQTLMSLNEFVYVD